MLDNEHFEYAYAEAIPEAFELKNYTYTVAELPKEDVPFKFYLTAATLNNKVLYLNGEMSSYYMATTTNVAEAITVYAEKAEGGYKFYTNVNEVKTYISMVQSGTHVNMSYVTENAVVYKYDATKNCWYTNVGGTNYYPGTYYDSKKDKTHETVSASKTSYINASNTGVTQFPLELMPVYSVAIITGNPRVDMDAVKMVEAVAGTEIDLTAPTAVGKTFVAWTDVEGNVIEELTVTCSTAVHATWTVTPYTLTIKQEGAEDVTIKFGVQTDPNSGIEATPDTLAFILESKLPENTAEFTYAWAEEIPEEFVLQNYTFTVVATAVETPPAGGDEGEGEGTNPPAGDEGENTNPPADEEKPGILDKITGFIPQPVKDMVGCSGVVGGIAGGAAALGLAVVALLKKKEDNE